MLDLASEIIAVTAHQIATAAPDIQPTYQTSNSSWAVIDSPVRSYLAQNTRHLAVSGSTVYALWQAAGLFGLIGGFFRSTAARLTYTLWGAVTIAMVWSASPAGGCTVATGIAALAWTMASAFALRGLSLRPVMHTVFQPRIDIRPEVHLPPAPAHPGDLDDGERESVRRLRP